MNIIINFSYAICVLKTVRDYSKIRHKLLELICTFAYLAVT